MEEEDYCLHPRSEVVSHGPNTAESQADRDERTRLFQTRRRHTPQLNFEIFDQLDYLALSDVPRYVSASLEGAD